MKKIMMLGTALVALTASVFVLGQKEAQAQYGGCRSQVIYPQRVVQNGHPGFYAYIRQGFVQQIEIRWHDNLGSENDARGRVFLDEYPIGDRDVKEKGNISYFDVRNYTRGQLRVKAVHDDLYINWIKVIYC